VLEEVRPFDIDPPGDREAGLVLHNEAWRFYLTHKKRGRAMPSPEYSSLK
jgi:hypothetical protein